MDSKPRRPGTFGSTLNLRCPPDIRQFLDAEATRQRMTPSELARRLVLAGIAAEGLTLPEPSHR